MTSRVLFSVLVVLAVVGAVLSFLAAGNLTVAIPFALLATSTAATAAALALADRLRWARPALPAAEEPAAITLRDSLRGGALGRQTAIAHLRALERRFPTTFAPISPEEEARVVGLARGSYLKWVEQRVAALEAST